MVRLGWSPNQRDWNAEAILLKLGAGRRFFGFDQYDENFIPSAPGIYIFSAEPLIKGPDPKYKKVLEFRTPLYVGKTDNLRRRFNQHRGDPDVNIQQMVDVYGVKLDYSYIQVDLKDLGDVEDWFVRSFGPIFNRINAKARIKDGVDIG